MPHRPKQAQLAGRSLFTCCEMRKTAWNNMETGQPIGRRPELIPELAGISQGLYLNAASRFT
eukprot:3544024-Pleurochrysis_carterae.AAC.6